MKKIEERALIFKNPRGEKLWGVLNLPIKKGKVPAVIIAHGFNGSKSERKFVKLARQLSKNGIAVLRFDFSGCGDSEGDFEKMSIHQEVEDLKAAYENLARQPSIDRKRIGVLGHSLGALIACLFQIKNSVAKTLVLIAPALDQENLFKIWYNSKEITKWRKKGYIDTPKCRIGLQYLNEAKNYTSVASNLKIPTLIIHGKKDKDVPLKFSKRLLKLLGGKRKMVVVDDADHNFENYKALNALINHSRKWFNKTL